MPEDEGLTRLQYLDLLHDGYASMGQAMPEEFRCEYEQLRNDEAAELDRKTQIEAKRQLAMFGWVGTPVKSTDITNV